ncbi:HlyD family type I secretion periplasmic adaptor subunit [Altererythrobacter sp. GH1-8]|uniref:HlyD family type I secretion periplasmic adaptor subunit n=1 Tax=Altererythrobacter sp. GH1-8 TaxID=3349333 RepID=UPI00374DCB13
MNRVRQWFETFSDWDANRKLIAICGATLFLLIAWASVAQTEEVTRGMGKVIPSSKEQLVQSAEPAVIEEILVRAGQSVKRGQLLVRLDDDIADSELSRLETENERLAARASRLEGEASGNEIGCEEGSLCAEERRLQAARVATAQSQQASLASAVEQRRRDLAEAQSTVSTLQNSVRLAQDQVNMLEPLARQGIVPRTELLTAQRDLVDTQGRLAAARQGVARSQAAIRQAQADLAAARSEFQQQALNEASEINQRIAVNEETIRGAEARRNRNELRAPADGIVNDVQVTTVGGFVNAGEKIMAVVPVGDKLLVEARVAPKDIAFIQVGHRANVKVTAYDFATYGGLSGRVRQVSADSIYDEAERETYYTVLIETDRAYLTRGGQQLPIVPGMICDVEIITGSKTVLSYLLKPVTRALNEAMTER